MYELYLMIKSTLIVVNFESETQSGTFVSNEALQTKRETIMDKISGIKKKQTNARIFLYFVSGVSAAMAITGIILIIKG